MKKWFFTVFLAFVTLFMGCSAYTNVVYANMSDMRINFFYGKCSDYFCTLSSGYRESEFIYDGNSTKNVECGVIALGFYETHLYSHISVLLNIDGNEKEYILEKSPYEDLFMVDIEKIVPSDATVTVNLKNNDTKVTLSELSSTWKIDYKTAIEIGSKHFDETLKGLYFNKKLNCECYLKVVYNEEFGDSYWYFSIIDRAQNVYNCLIDTIAGKVISSENNNMKN